MEKAAKWVWDQIKFLVTNWKTFVTIWTLLTGAVAAYQTNASWVKDEEIANTQKQVTEVAALYSQQPAEVPRGEITISNVCDCKSEIAKHIAKDH